MAITPNFTRGQTYGLPNQINLVDTSTGSDTQSITQRRVYVYDKDGNYYVQIGTTTNYEEWGDYPATTTKTLNILTRDLACNVRVDWLDASNVVQQSVTILSVFVLYSITYYIFLTKAQSSNNKLKDRANFYQNYIKLLVSIKEANDSITILSDISSSQAALNRAYSLISKPANFF
jgi:hypothetical protein